MNLLITSIGQRGYLVDHFKESSNGEIGIFAADATKYAPALQNADKSFTIPMANDPKYFSRLLKICKENNVKGIISINDLELPVLAKHKEEFLQHGITPIISDSEIIDICFDKFKTYEFCLEFGIPVPRTYLWDDKDKIIDDLSSGIISFPIITKPRKGSRSVGIRLIHSMEDLIDTIKTVRKQEISEDEKLMFQEYIESDQYSIHVFNDSSLTPVSVVTMVNIFRHFGETFHIKTYRDEKLINLGVEIGKKLKHMGPLSADVHQRENGDYVILEFNPRLSGGYSLSHFAGADFTGKILKMMDNQSISSNKIDGFEDNVVMLKQFTTAKISEEEITQKINDKS